MVNPISEAIPMKTQATIGNPEAENPFPDWPPISGLLIAPPEVSLWLDLGTVIGIGITTGRGIGGAMIGEVIFDDGTIDWDVLEPILELDLLIAKGRRFAAIRVFDMIEVEVRELLIIARRFDRSLWDLGRQLAG